MQKTIISTASSIYSGNGSFLNQHFRNSFKTQTQFNQQLDSELQKNQIDSRDYIQMLSDSVIKRRAMLQSELDPQVLQEAFFDDEGPS